MAFRLNAFKVIRFIGIVALLSYIYVEFSEFRKDQKKKTQSVVTQFDTRDKGFYNSEKKDNNGTTQINITGTENTTENATTQNTANGVGVVPSVSGITPTTETSLGGTENSGTITENTTTQAEAKNTQEVVQQDTKKGQDTTKKTQADAQLKAQQEAAKKAQADAQSKAQQEAAKKAQADAQLKAQQEAAKKAQADAQLKAQQEAAKKAQADAQAKAQQEAAKKAQEQAQASTQQSRIPAGAGKKYIQVATLSSETAAKNVVTKLGGNFKYRKVGKNYVIVSSTTADTQALKNMENQVNSKIPGTTYVVRTTK